MSRQGKKIVEYIFLILLACLFIFPLLWMIVSSMKPESHIYLDMNSIKAFLPSMD
ncbi:ABC transporter permease, partial [Pseudomonas sp. 2588-5]